LESFLPYCSSIISNEYNIYLALLIAGLISGFTHCAGMCGPFVVMQTSANMASDSKNNISELTRLKNSSLLPYHLGRILTYTVNGGVAAYFSSHILAFDGMRWFAALMLGFSGFMFISYALTKNKRSILGFNLTLPKILENKAKLSYGSNFVLSKFKFNNFQKLAVFFSGLVLLTVAYRILFRS